MKYTVRNLVQNYYVSTSLPVKLIAEQTAHVVVPHAIKVLRDKGYKLVTVAECLGVKPYQSVSSPQKVRYVRFRFCHLCLFISFRERGPADQKCSI